jgi:hypothetical protein
LTVAAQAPAALTHIVHRAAELKAGITSQDEKEGGVRAVLNWGHTVGHAVEVLDLLPALVSLISPRAAACVLCSPLTSISGSESSRAVAWRVRINRLRRGDDSCGAHTPPPSPRTLTAFSSSSASITVLQYGAGKCMLTGLLAVHLSG